MKYIPSIGIECHVQLNTHTKLFAAVGNDARNAEPNTLISPICLGLPGTLPVLNQAAVDKAARFAFAVNSRPEKHSIFERKHYFYPDLPKGYQITQLSQPIVKGGHVEIDPPAGGGGQTKIVRLNRVQLEEDAGKNTHPDGKDYSLVDLNRAGTPLLEIVSEPDIESAEQAKAYVRELYLLVRYSDVGDADLYHGNMRFDVNVSVSKDPNKLGTRTETKNLNSFKSVEKAVEYEIKRQTELLENGKKIVQETRGWDDAKQKTFAQRGKEEAHDYRYMPEPDIPPVELSEDYIKDVEASMPVLPRQWRERLESLKLNPDHIETLLEAEVEDERFSYLPLIEESIKDKEHAKFLANYFVNIEIPMRRGGKVDEDLKDAVRAEIYAEVYELLKSGKLSSTSAKSLLTSLLGQAAKPENIEKFAQEQGYIQVSDEGEIAKIVEEVLGENPQAAADVKAGELKAIGFLVGQVMKKSLGKANPELAQRLIKKQLDI
ncbi:glutaminyl-tRNA synthase (glutamine-hydrolyzing) subunit B [Candidatus Saccharibacteria bacterium RIFCSPHIGHO2_02_FULL_47_12]|nr:MAG: glutaminyl-tRNA synthase (glutamine-hydrolyzing) subunit B [Candidatus Saccharibacteria bacterium RIFCSPHIGHO2_02_FULL_47_12]